MARRGFITDVVPWVVDAEFNQFVQPLIGRLVPILLNSRSPKSLTENAAVTIGRIALVQPNLVAPYLETFAQQWYDRRMVANIFARD